MKRLSKNKEKLKEELSKFTKEEIMDAEGYVKMLEDGVIDLLDLTPKQQKILTLLMEK